MKLRKNLLKTILISVMLMIMTPISVHAASINLAIDKFRGQDSDGTYPAYSFASQYIYKIYEVNNGTKNYNRPIYCLDASRGFGSNTAEWGLNATKEYNKSLDMLNDTDKETIINYETSNNNSFSSEDYEKVIKILKNSYIAGSTDKEEFLKKMISNYNSNEYYITDKDIEVAQQLAIWHYTNENTITGNQTFGQLLGNNGIVDIYAAIYADENKATMGGPIKYILDNNGNVETTDIDSNYTYYSLTDLSSKYKYLFNMDTDEYIGDATYKGMWNRFKGISQIYKSLLDKAEAEDTTNSNAKPLEISSDQPSLTEDNGNFIIGPFKVNKINDNYYDYAASITDESGNTITGYTLLDANKKTTIKNIEELVGEEFYIQISNTIQVAKIKYSFSAQYDLNTITYWTNGLNVSTTQPVAIVEKTPIDLKGEKEIIIPQRQKTFDLSLRKFISEVGKTKYDREPVVNVSNLYPNGVDKTAKYVHSKIPVSVEVGDIVTYTIRVYNEGEIDGYVGKVTDYLPDELTFISELNPTDEDIKDATEFNAAYGWTRNTTTGGIETTVLAKNTEYTSTQQEICNEQNRENAMLRAFNGNTLDYIDLKVKCRVNEKAKESTKITNIAEITNSTDSEGNSITDRDSTPDNFPDDKKNNEYNGNGSENGYIPGQEDDDDFEKVVIKTFDLSLRKYISYVNGVGLDVSREPVVDVTPLKEGISTSAKYNHKKDPVEVKIGDVVTYTIRVYNEGSIDGYAAELTEYFPTYLAFDEEDELNKQYGWKLIEDSDTNGIGMLKTTYLNNRLLKAYNGGNTLDCTDMKVNFIVKSDVGLDTVMTNTTEISVYENAEHKLEKDRDSGEQWDVGILDYGIPLLKQVLMQEYVSQGKMTEKAVDYTCEYVSIVFKDYIPNYNLKDYGLSAYLEANNMTSQEFVAGAKQYVENKGETIPDEALQLAYETIGDDSNEELLVKYKEYIDKFFQSYKGIKENKSDLSDSGYYYSGQEDDDDFEKIIILKSFDLSLRKYISDVDGASISGREPVIDITKLKNRIDTTAEYNHSKQPINVVRGSIVTYTIAVYNEGNVDGYVNEITDYLPVGLEFVVDSEINEKYNWKVSEDGRKVTTDYLKYTEGSTENLLKAYDGGEKLNSKFVQIQCKVKDTAEYRINITNLAQITDESDSEGNHTIDLDSIPDGNFELPKDEDLPRYKDDELSKDYVPGQEDDDDFEKVKVVYFDLALRKIVSKAIVIEDGKQAITETGHKFEDDPEEIVKVDLGRKNLNKVTVKFEYQIRITNEGMIEGYAKEVKDYIPEGLKFNAEDNPLWKEVSEGVITTDQLKDTLLKPGESRVVTVLLTWKNGQDNLGLKVNVAEISKDYNTFNTPDIDSTPDNQKDGEDDIDDAPVMLSIILGNAVTYVGLTIIMLITTAGGIFLIKKFVL